MKIIILKLINLYQKFIKPTLNKFIFSGGGCRFTPSCSEYAYQAIGKYGTINGLFKSLKRISRCHPFSKGGYDPVK
ncbi:membrane protein insertion efficiency factor YidD [Candidatus Gottesmanbacteria bacterium CG11_big_fil_rev_8_21_14_0_20_37_11]|uniref:Putative membrane protein insertion efficiency factor n=2 Tax=Candidatus Gottesmaniibacteriota TaxID=1752720 RepID=A0A2M7RST5_9BACT|nr:MAG: membrane protein insertion efficiency factor YidD [Candidatus Gottesmanbacteria bacterium CG23_combo_of_CG06-09_8_20_14_all_37_19]PIR08079.1 MAG: membrane protein insertion efficiency factor YidD [Candidatus Gottesmanbacteria bacterium CG11_big_fil_rev_8_21_14_0_20_37_11]PIZ03316.1 MAG: membrane protein insertion efficiency factor YidD [Candidatus Gottesmanbacteria bacterium CG_4_10_14_0_8_um_filter_37_24]